MKKKQAQSNRVGANLSVRPLMCLALLPLLIVLGAVDASAQGQADTPKSPSLSDIHQLEEIVVTATRRTESVMDVPFSVNVQEEADIQRLNTFSLEGLSRNIAGLNIQNLGPGQTVVNIRGISSGQIVRDQPGIKEQVVHLSGRHADCDLAVYPGPRSLRRPTRGNPAWPARHAVRLRVHRRHRAVRHQQASTRRQGREDAIRPEHH